MAQALVYRVRELRLSKEIPQESRALSHAAVRSVRQNLFLAFVNNGIGVPIAAGLLYRVLGVQLSPVIAALAMSLSSVSVVSNALRLRRLKQEGVARTV